jgi:hypothetical protein
MCKVVCVLCVFLILRGFFFNHNANSHHSNHTNVGVNWGCKTMDTTFLCRPILTPERGNKWMKNFIFPFWDDFCICDKQLRYVTNNFAMCRHSVARTSSSLGRIVFPRLITDTDVTNYSILCDYM